MEDKKNNKLPGEIKAGLAFCVFGLFFLLLGYSGFGICCLLFGGYGVFLGLKAIKKEKDTGVLIANRRTANGDGTVREKVDPETIKRAEEDFVAFLDDRRGLYEVARIYDVAVAKSDSGDLATLKEAKALFEQISDKLDVQIELDDCNAKINRLGNIPNSIIENLDKSIMTQETKK